MEIEELKVIKRPFKEETDIPFIYSSWRKSLWFDERRDENSDLFFRVATKRIKEILTAKECKVNVSCLQSDKNFIVGYSVGIKDNLEFVYVKIDYRKKGIAKLLTKEFKTISEPETKIGRAIAFKNNLAQGELNGNITKGISS